MSLTPLCVTAANAMTTLQLDSMVCQGQFILGTIRGTGALNENPVPYLGQEYKAIWVDAQGHGYKDTLIIKPISARSKRCYFTGMVNNALEAGLNKPQAIAWASCSVPYKFELLKNLAQVLRDTYIVNALLQHPGVYGPESGRKAWHNEWKLKLGVKVPREAALAKLVKHVVNDTK